MPVNIEGAVAIPLLTQIVHGPTLHLSGGGSLGGEHARGAGTGPDTGIPKIDCTPANAPSMLLVSQHDHNGNHAVLLGGLATPIVYEVTEKIVIAVAQCDRFFGKSNDAIRAPREEQPFRHECDDLCVA